MKKLATTIAMLALAVSLAGTAMASNAVRISQVYGGGGGSTGSYNKDYIELFNNSGVAVSLVGWSLEYGSATGTSFGSTVGNQYIFPAGASIAPCSYLLIELGTLGTNGAVQPVTPDYTTTSINMSATTGKIALVNNTALNNLCSNPPVFIDRVGYGPTANCFELAPASVLTNSSSLVRGGGGTTDFDDNSTDFTTAPTLSTPFRNSASPANTTCLVTPTGKQTWGKVKVLYR